MAMLNTYSEPTSPGHGSFSDEQLIMAAQLYYEQGLSQVEVARTAGVSQPQVSRMLGLARERGLVKITIAGSTTRNAELEAQISSLFNVKSVVVIGAMSRLSRDQARGLTAHFAAPYVSAFVDDAQCIAVAGGRMLSATSRHTSPRRRGEPPVFVQAMGNTGPTANDWDAVEVGRRMASQWHGQFQMLNTPAFFADASACKAVQRLPQIRSVLEQLDRAELALLGIGTPEDSVFVEYHSLTEPELKRVQRAGAVGEIAGRYFDAQGRECATSLKDRVIGIQLERLRKTPNVVAVVAGENRAIAVIAAVAGKLINHLILDYAAATTVVKMATGTPLKRKK